MLPSCKSSSHATKADFYLFMYTKIGSSSSVRCSRIDMRLLHVRFTEGYAMARAFFSNSVSYMIGPSAVHSSKRLGSILQGGKASLRSAVRSVGVC